MRNNLLTHELTDLVELDQPLNPDLGSGSSRPLLSADSLQQLPDSSQNRLDMIPAQLERIDKPGGNRTSDSQSDDIPLDVDSPDDDQSGERPAELQNHLEQREAFRVHLLSLPGALSVRFCECLRSSHYGISALIYRTCRQTLWIMDWTCKLLKRCRSCGCNIVIR